MNVQEISNKVKERLPDIVGTMGESNSSFQFYIKRGETEMNAYYYAYCSVIGDVVILSNFSLPYHILKPAMEIHKVLIELLKESGYKVLYTLNNSGLDPYTGFNATFRNHRTNNTIRVYFGDLLWKY